MSRQLINEYRADLDQLKMVSGSRRETNLRPAFARLLRAWGKQNDLIYLEEHQKRADKGNLISIDGALTVKLGIPFGYWEAKDADDKLDNEIADKFRRGYPKDNIIFSDDVTAVLYQDGHEAMRAAMDDAETLLPLLTRFFAHERQEIADFKKAVKQFAIDLPAVLTALRDIIQTKRASSREFAKAQDDFLRHARDAINPAVTEDDVQEMLIQHILTEDIFAKVFENPDFHRQNNVAAALIALEHKLFGPGDKQKLLKALQPYYAGISATAAVIESHTEKQGFLKGLYENFYKVYNPMAADRLGVVYTPGEIVRFMIKSADWLCETHFGKNLIDKGVEILDPATGTGTFIVELLESFRTGGDQAKLKYKYANELHANEVAILPYYVANLNIEATYAAITGQFAEYPNLCFVDTLDNVAALGIYSGHQSDMFGSVSDENMGRIKRQNERKISVIIGNPPYNASQKSENDRNKNRAYARIDERIKQTYVKASSAQKTQLYDMYTRFFRWATDRLTDDGVLAFITNRSFIESRTFDGFRRIVAQDFNEIWVVDLGGDVRANPKLSGTKHNVFGIQTGVAICYLVRKKGVEGCTIRYVRRPEDETAEDKLSWLGGADLREIAMTELKIDAGSNWLNGSIESDWTTFLPACLKPSGVDLDNGLVKAIFSFFSNGVLTARDEWVYDKSSIALKRKIEFFLDVLDNHRGIPVNDLPDTIKISSSLKVPKNGVKFDKKLVRAVAYRAFTNEFYYFDERFSDRLTANHTESLYPIGQSINPTIAFRCVASSDALTVLAAGGIFDYGFVKTGNGGTGGLARYRYTKSGERVDNITDWAVAQFLGAYASNPSPLAGEGGPKGRERGRAASADQKTLAPNLAEESLGAPTRAAPSPLAAKAAPPSPARGEGVSSPPATITKDAIFAYCYAVLHDPLYREKYALNLKREFPRIPFYPDFAQWVAWGEALLTLHIGYEDVKPAKLTRVDTPAPKRAEGTHPKPKLKSDAQRGHIQIDEDTQLTGIPPHAWDYRLGNRSAIDWVLDQHKEKTPRDPTIREKFNTYRFADYKESCIVLLAKVVRVSVETVAITDAMKEAAR